MGFFIVDFEQAFVLSLSSDVIRTSTSFLLNQKGLVHTLICNFFTMKNLEKVFHYYFCIKMKHTFFLFKCSIVLYQHVEYFCIEMQHSFVSKYSILLYPNEAYFCIKMRHTFLSKCSILFYIKMQHSFLPKHYFCRQIGIFYCHLEMNKTLSKLSLNLKRYPKGSI